MMIPRSGEFMEIVQNSTSMTLSLDDDGWIEYEKAVMEKQVSTLTNENGRTFTNILLYFCSSV